MAALLFTFTRLKRCLHWAAESDNTAVSGPGPHNDSRKRSLTDTSDSMNDCNIYQIPAMSNSLK